MPDLQVQHEPDAALELLQTIASHMAEMKETLATLCQAFGKTPPGKLFVLTEEMLKRGAENTELSPEDQAAHDEYVRLRTEREAQAKAAAPVLVPKNTDEPPAPDTVTGHNRTIF